MAEVKGIPYGIAQFADVRKGNYYYVDKTKYLHLMEETSNYLFLIRPRRFGKSLFVSMMREYYDIAKKEVFDSLFDGLWVKEHPTPLRNSYQVIYFDFSLVGVGKGTLEDKFNQYISIELDFFINKYKDYYSQDFCTKVLNAGDAGERLRLINKMAHEMGYPLYLIIDEYDNFTNVVLSAKGTDTFRALTHADGFYREYFKLFKAMFSRIFLIGVSPITLDDLSSGYNIDWGISQDPRFNAMLGFSDSEVRQMFQYYKDNGKLPKDADIEAMIEEMRPWYDNYCFAKECLSEERVFNSDMVLYYLRNYIIYGNAPEDMVDKNIKTDYSKLEMLASIDSDKKNGERMSVIEEVAATGEVLMTLKTSFPAIEIMDDDNFRSLIYYYGMLTMGGTRGQRIRMVIPNNCVRQQYWGFMRKFYEKDYDMKTNQLRDEMDYMAYDGNWQPLIEHIAKAYKECPSVRDSILGEHNLQGFFKAYMAMNTYYLVWPEIELNYGYADFLMMPDLKRYPDVEHCYIMELKYVKPTATDAEVQAKAQEAESQLHQYAADENLMRQCGTTKLHLLKVIFKGAEMVTCKEDRRQLLVAYSLNKGLEDKNRIAPST